MPPPRQLRQRASGRERLAEEKGPSGAQRALGRLCPGSSSSRESPAAAQPSRPVTAITKPAISGAAQGRRATRESCRMKSSVNTDHAARRIAYAPLQRTGHQIAQRRAGERRRAVQPSRGRRHRCDAEGRQPPDRAAPPTSGNRPGNAPSPPPETPTRFAWALSARSALSLTAITLASVRKEFT